jgi:uncharacterized repeat protein (TIGR02543 family)
MLSQQKIASYAHSIQRALTSTMYAIFPHMNEVPMYRCIILFLIGCLLTSPNMMGATRTSTGSGSWSNASNWSPSGAPQTGDDVIIAAGHNISLNGITVTLNSLTVSGTLTTANNTSQSLAITTNVVVNGGGTLSVTSSGNAQTFALAIAGDLTANGTIITSAGNQRMNFTFNGSSGQAIGGSASVAFNNLTINNSAGVVLGASQTVNGVLSLTSGNITTGAHTLAIGATGSVSRSSGHIVGSLLKNVAAGSGVNRTFEIGSENGYTPVQVNFESVSTQGTLTAMSTPDDHPMISSSGVITSKSVNRYWTITNSGVAFTTYHATFHFPSGDVDPGANASNFSVVRYDGLTWSYPSIGTRTDTSTQVTSSDAFGDFQIGELETYTITASTFGNGTITPSGAVTVVHGSTASFTITPDIGHHIDSVLIDGVNAGVLTSHAFTSVAGNHTIVAYFSINSYAISATAGNHGQIDPTGVVHVVHGDDQHFGFVPDVGYHVDSVIVDGALQPDSTNGFTFENVTDSHTIHVSFAGNEYTLSISVDGPGSVVADPDQLIYVHGDTVHLTALATANHHFVNWSADASGSANPLHLVMDTDKSITAHFAIDTLTITAIALGGGSINPSGAVQVTYGSSQMFSIVPDVGYHTDSVLVNGANKGVLSDYTFVNVQGDSMIAAYFSINTYTITATAGANGSISPAGSVMVPHFSTPQFVFTPNSGYHVDSVIVDGVYVPDSTAHYTFASIAASHMIHVVFAINQYTISPSAGLNGQVSPNTPQNVAHGASMQFVFIPNTGYHVDSVLVDGVNYPDSTSHYTFQNVSGNHTIHVTFAINTYTLVVNAVNGSVLKDPNQASYTHGTSVQLTATPDTGYHFTGWSGDTSGLANPITIVMTGNKTVTASFAINTYTLNVIIDGNGSVDRNPDQANYNHGTPVTLTAAADSGYTFRSWTGSVSSTNNPLVVTMNGNKSITALFRVPDKFLSIPPDSLIVQSAGKLVKSVRRKPGKPMPPPNWVNLLEEVVVQGGFQPNSPQSDAAGGMVVGKSFMSLVGPNKWKPNKIKLDTAWVRLTKWDFSKSRGKNAADVQKTLLDKVGKHDTYVRGLDSTLNPQSVGRKLLKGQLTRLAPAKGKNKLFAELVALKLNIAASSLQRTPVGFGELVYDNDASSFDEMTVAEIAQQANLMMTYWKQYTPDRMLDLYNTVSAINRAFIGPPDTVSFMVNNRLVLKGAVDVATVPFLRMDELHAPMTIDPTTDETESVEDFDDEDWDEGVPVVSKLYSNYPNPFNPQTTISFRLREPSRVTLKVYNTLGQEVATLFNNEELDEGLQSIAYVATRMASGVYFFRVDVQPLGDESGVSDATHHVGKMLLVK